MPKPNNDLVNVKITRVSKQKLEFVKSQYFKTEPGLAKGDYAAIAHLVEQEYDRLLQSLVTDQV